VPLGVNRGQPTAIADAGADFSRAIREIAKSLLAPEAPRKRRRLAALARA
jgi:Flp pilus assembly CpaE family ATPase